MPIQSVRVYHQWLPFRGGSYRMHHGGAVGIDSFVVALESEDGLVGHGEVGLLGSFYSQGFPAGAQAGLADLASLVLGEDATRPRSVLALLDASMRGQAYVKTAIDMACWDAAG